MALEAAKNFYKKNFRFDNMGGGIIRIWSGASWVV